MSTSDSIPNHIHHGFTPESLSPTEVCDLRVQEGGINKYFFLNHTSSPQKQDFIAVARQKRVRHMEINLLFAIFLIPFVITRQEKSPLKLTEATG